MQKLIDKNLKYNLYDIVKILIRIKYKNGINFLNKFLLLINDCYLVNIFLGIGDWGLGIGDWGLGDRKSVV